MKAKNEKHINPESAYKKRIVKLEATVMKMSERLKKIEDAKAAETLQTMRQAYKAVKEARERFESDTNRAA